MPTTYTVVSLALGSSIELSHTAGAAPSTNDTFPNDGLTFLFFTNNGGSNGTVTPVSQTNLAPPGFGVIAAVTDPQFTITAGTSRLVGPFAPARFNNASGQVTLTYGGTLTNVRVAAVRFTPIT